MIFIQRDRVSQSQIVCGLSLRFYFGLWPFTVIKARIAKLCQMKKLSLCQPLQLLQLLRLKIKKTAQTIWFKPPLLIAFPLGEGVERSETEEV